MTGREVSDRRARPKRRRQCALVEIIEFTAHRHAMRKPGDLDVETGKAVCDVVGGCLPLHRRIDGDDKLADAAGADTVDQALDIQVLRPDAVPPST